MTTCRRLAWRLAGGSLCLVAIPVLLSIMALTILADHLCGVIERAERALDEYPPGAPCPRHGPAAPFLDFTEPFDPSCRGCQYAAVAPRPSTEPAKERR